MSLELKQRRFPSSFVRAWVNRIYGSDPAGSTWVRWREWAGVPKDSKFFTFEQLCFVSAIATLRAHYIQRRELHKWEILEMANSLEIQEPIATIVQRLDATGTIAGCDAIEALRARGYRVSLQTLYRAVPKFSLQKVYEITYLERRIA